MSTHRKTLEGSLTPAQEKTYVLLPFDMPPGATRLEVEYWYSQRIGSHPQLIGGSTIDLGVFDARGIDFLSAGFRGWSGSERLQFFITETDATPAYLAGALIPGQWHIVLGLYKIAPEGSTFRIDITITTEPGHTSIVGLPAPTQEFAAAHISPRAGGWVRGELHCHTIHSDGESTPAAVIQMARERGLDFLAITDHNSLSCQQELAKLENPGILLIRGIEVTTFKGHFNVWGIGDWVDFRVLRPEDMAAAIRFAVERGAVTTCNHPMPFGPMWDYTDVEGYHCIEVWNGPWHLGNQMSLNFWTERLAQGKRFVAIGGSDYHRQVDPTEPLPRAVGRPTVWVKLETEPSAAAILSAIRRGHVSLSDEPDGPFLDLRARTNPGMIAGGVLARDKHEQIEIELDCRRGAGHVLQLFDQRGVLYEQPISQAQETIRTSLAISDRLFVRAELRDREDNVRALTNPIYLE